MKRISLLITLFGLAATVVFAHEGNEHVRGVVTNISPKSITVETTAKTTKTLTLTDKTTFQQAGKTAHLADLKVGDRVVVDVPEKTTEALLIQIGTAAAAPAPKAAASATKLDITFQTQPKPMKVGNNSFEVMVKDGAGQPLNGADVSVLLTMPAMPAMKMPAMRNDVNLKAAEPGKYTGTGQVMVAGDWTVTVSVKQGGKEVAQKKLLLSAK